MKLYMIHCGFYDAQVCDGLYESHVNFFVAADDIKTATAKVKLIPEFQRKKMHVDGLQEIQAVEGLRVNLVCDEALNHQTIIVNHKHRELAPPSKDSGD